MKLMIMQRLDLSQVMLKTALKYHFNSIAPIPDDSLALLDVHPDDPRQEENIHRKPMLDRGLQLMSEASIASLKSKFKDYHSPTSAAKQQFCAHELVISCKPCQSCARSLSIKSKI